MGGVDEGMKVSDNKLESRALPGWHVADLLEGAVTVEDFLHAHPVVVSSQQEVDLVIILSPT